MKSQIPNVKEVPGSELRVESSESKVEIPTQNSQPETSEELETRNPKPETKEQPETRNSKLETLQEPETRNLQPETGKISALSLGSIRAKKELMEAQKGVVKAVEHLPSEAFTETQMLEFWFKYAQRLSDKGLMIMSSLLQISDPKLEGTRIVYELPNEGSKIDFDRAKPELLGYLRGHLHNHDITIDVIVNEEVKVKNAFTPQDKYNRLNEINPNLEVLRRMFDLEI
ncbi:DNA polymerase III subunit gamma/tau [Flavobacterium sp.]|uniref:DNA polymerase III subunit gamma/tau n=1 Tax=Flavobacterium sp. TaxID=239 RepID=UPI002619268C|nr:DNA polymerase III subunit gamma/tau [Flavobacterium sp.]